MKQIILTFLALMSPVWSYNILAIFPVPSKSHNLLGQGVVGALLKAGHEVTWATPYPTKEVKEGLTYIDVSETHNFIKDLNPLEIAHMGLGKLVKFGRNISIAAAKNKGVQHAILTQQFDAVITDLFFADLHAGFAAVLQVPWIILSGQIVHSGVELVAADVSTAALVPAIISNFGIPMNLWQRMANNVMVYVINFGRIYDSIISEKYYIEIFEPLAKKRGVVLPPYSTAIHNVSILLSNSHPSLAPAISLPPNVVDIAGYHIADHHKPMPKLGNLGPWAWHYYPLDIACGDCLPGHLVLEEIPENNLQRTKEAEAIGDLQDLMDNSKNGVVYFSMGSVIQASTLSEDIKKELVQILGSIPYTVLWKFEETMKDLPTNIHIRPWIPQPAILAHPNVKLFITHGGLLSTLEAVHAGVPLLAMPVYGDQPGNAVRAESAGYAISVPFEPFNGERVKEALNELLTDQKYYNKAKELSRVFNNRPVPATKLISHYVELAIETKGALHLRSPTYHYQWYERYMLDQLAVLLVALYAVTKLVKVVHKMALNSIFSKQPVKKDKIN